MNIIFLIFRKYDEIVSINDIPVTEGDQNLVRSLLDGALTTLNMVSQGGTLCAPFCVRLLSNRETSVIFSVEFVLQSVARKAKCKERKIYLPI